MRLVEDEKTAEKQASLLDDLSLQEQFEHVLSESSDVDLSEGVEDFIREQLSGHTIYEIYNALQVWALEAGDGGLVNDVTTVFDNMVFQG